MVLRCESLEPPMSQLGQTRKSARLNGMSVLSPIVLQKSFCLTDPRFFGLYARRSNVDVGDHFIL